MSHSYPSDISREQFTRILPDLESGLVRRFLRGALSFEKRVPVADAPCGLPQLASGLKSKRKKIGWRGPEKQWSERAEQLLAWRRAKNTDSAEQKGYDAGKKVSESSATSRWILRGCPMRST